MFLMDIERFLKRSFKFQLKNTKKKFSTEKEAKEKGKKAQETKKNVKAFSHLMPNATFR